MMPEDKRTGREVELGGLLTPERTGREVELGPRLREGMVLIPAGEFIMGTSDSEIEAMLRQHQDWSRSWFDDEKPPHHVYLDAYWIDQYPVTVARYRVFCQTTGRQEPPPPRWGWKDDHPIVNVSWHDAEAYCQWAGSDSSEFSASRKVRLPTEAEWEKAARGTDGRIYPWGNEWDGRKCANSVGSNNLHSTVPVGSYPQGVSPYGIHDMAGNVWEWCSSLYQPYPYRADDGREGRGKNVAGEYRVLRGGSWLIYNVNLFRCANRHRDDPDYWDDFGGFRCAQSLSHGERNSVRSLLRAVRSRTRRKG